MFNRIAHHILKHAKWYLTVIAILTVAFGWGMTRLTIKMGNEVFVNSHSAIYKHTQTYQKYFGGDAAYLMLSGKQSDIISHHTMQKVAKFSDKAEKVDNVKSTTTIVNSLNQLLAKTDFSSLMGSMSDQEVTKLEKDVQANLTTSQQNQLTSQVQASLTSDQTSQVSTYVSSLLTTDQQSQVTTYTNSLLTTEQTAAIQQTAMGLLTTQQQAQLAQAAASGQDTSSLLQTSLTSEQQAQVQAATLAQLTDQQKQAVQAYTLTLLTDQQKQQMQTYTLSILNDQQRSAMMSAAVKMLPKVQNMSTSLLRDILLDQNGKVRSQFQQLLPQNGRNMLVLVNTTSASMNMVTDVQLRTDLHQALQQTHFGKTYRVRFGGQPLILGEVNNVVWHTMGELLIFAVVLMIVVLAIIFKVRRRLLSLAFVLIGLIWTFGIMGWLGIPITIATMAVLPIVIGLGTDFGVQFHNRYEEEFKKSHDYQAATYAAIPKIGPAVGVALIMMTLSFLTMIISKAPIMQQFGVTLAFGVISVYLVEFVMMYTINPLRDRHFKAKDAKLPKPSRVGGILARYANFVMNHAVIVLILGVLVAATGFWAETKIPTETSLIKLIPSNMSSLVQTKGIQRHAGSTTYLTYLVKADDVRQKDNLEKIEQLGNQVNRKYKNVESVQSIATVYKEIDGSYAGSQSQINTQIANLPTTLTDTTISKNHHYAAIQFKVKRNLSSNQENKLMKQINRQIAGKQGQLTISPAGSTMMQLVGVQNMTANHYLIIAAGLVIIFVTLLIVYRSIKVALSPLLPIVVVLGASPLTIWLRGGQYNPITIVLSSLVLGIGIEFTILLLERYQEEIQNTDTRRAMLRSVQSVGSAITVSGLTLIVGFVSLMFVNFPGLNALGISTVMDTAYSLIAALTFMPAIIQLTRDRKKDLDTK